MIPFKNFAKNGKAPLHIFEDVSLFEGASKNIDDMDVEFLKRAENVTTFNLKEGDFQSLDYKAEIQYLYKKNFFPNFDLENTISGDITIAKLQKAIGLLERESRANYLKMFDFEPGGTGPGEVVMYFLCDDGVLGGAGSAGVDLEIGSKKYEIKACQVTADKKFAYGFKLGATFATADIETEALRLAKDVGLTKPSEINKGTIAKIRAKFPGEWEKVEKKFQQRAYDNYFKSHEILFMHAGAGKKKPGKNRGKAVAIKQIKKSDIGLERYTSRTFKPIVRIAR